MCDLSEVQHCISKETPESHDMPSRPFWEVDKLSTTTAPTVITKLKSTFARYGCPETVISDNGPHFAGETIAISAKDCEIVKRMVKLRQPLKWQRNY